MAMMNVVDVNTVCACSGATFLLEAVGLARGSSSLQFAGHVGVCMHSCPPTDTPLAHLRSMQHCVVSVLDRDNS